MKKLNIKKLVNRAYQGKPLTIDQWNILENHLAELPDEFIIRFSPFFDWRMVKMEVVGYQKMFDVLFGKSLQAFEKKARRDYFLQNGPVNYAFDWSSLAGDPPEYDSVLGWIYPNELSYMWDNSLCYARGKFLENFPKIPEHLQGLIINRLWQNATVHGHQSYLFWTDDFPDWKKYFLVRKILSVDLGETTDRFVGGMLLYSVDREARQVMCQALNKLGTFGIGRLYRIYKKYIEPSDRNPYQSFAGFDKVYDYLDLVKFYGLDNLTTLPGTKERQEVFEKMEECD